jgi:hypothetical protein
VHPSSNAADYLLNDASKSDYLTANYMAYAAPQKGKMSGPTAEALAAIRRYVLLHALKQGSTTIIDVGGVRGEWDAYVDIIEKMGGRVYFSPAFRDRNTFTDTQGRLYYEADEQAGRKGLDEAIGSSRPMMGWPMAGCAACSVHHRSRPAASHCYGRRRRRREAACPIFTHAGGNLVEFHRIIGEYRRPRCTIWRISGSWMR